MSVNQYQRAYRAWSVLIGAAADKTRLTYKQLGDAIGIHHRAVRFVLGPIQEHCMMARLPPLTILAVGQDTGRPGHGFVAWDAADLAAGREQVYAYAWGKQTNPFTFAAKGATPDDVARRLVRAPELAAKIYVEVQSRGILQDIFRRELLQAYAGRCAFCGLSLADALQAAHIIPWTHASNAERLDPRNGLLLCATHHCLFDSGVLTVTVNGRIRCSLSKSRGARWTDADQRSAIGLDGRAIIVPADPRLHPLRHALRRRAAGF